MSEMRKKSRKGWQQYPYTFAATHDGETWQVSFKAFDADPKIWDDEQIIVLPGWYPPERVAALIWNVHCATNHRCKNADDYQQMVETLTAIANEPLPEQIKKATELAQRVQGKVTCIN